ncbi:low temperature requirement protein A [Kribbella ginsengisoli]|uniref:Low temperature requirement protein A n=1 Tax=Kribbella ginsengisoli TaxID=363865 RepID=A0ABP6W8Y5_9ACTN
MTSSTSPAGVSGVLRDNSPDPERVTYLELFFDLVFVFAITQISAVLTVEPTFLTLAQGLIICLAVWWVWVYTAWATNWLNPETRSVLRLLLALTAIGLVISESIPSAFGHRAHLFVAAYLAYGTLRTVGVIAATRTAAPTVAAGQWRILAWSIGSGALWTAGAAQHRETWRVACWGLAIATEYAGPAALFWLPGLGRSSWGAWRIRGGHFSERSALFVIIVLGESILVIGNALDTDQLTRPVVLAAAVSFIGAALLWFLYFAHGQARGRDFLAGRISTGPVARLSYTYLHGALIVGLVATIHGSELALHRPMELATTPDSVLVLLGPALYLGGLVAFKSSIGVRVGQIPAHLLGIASLTALFGLSALHAVSATLLELATGAMATMLLIAICDEILYLRRTRTEPITVGR